MPKKLPFAFHGTFDNVASLVGQIDVVQLRQKHCKTALAWGGKGSWTMFDGTV